MSNNESIEVAAASIDEAVQQALTQLEASEHDVTIEILTTPRSGLLGLGARQARVRVTRTRKPQAQTGVSAPAPAPRRNPPRSLQEPSPVGSESSKPDDDASEGRRIADMESQSREAAEILSRVLELMGERAELRRLPSDDESIELEIHGDGSGILIGRHGQTLDALEYIVNRVLARRIRDAVPISLETESYRARRRDQLHRMALAAGERAKRDGKSIRLDPMPPRDRRVVHVALKDDPLLTTRSVGDGFLRSIEIVAQTGRGVRTQATAGAPRGNRNRRGRGAGQPRETKESSTEPQLPSKGGLGEQGGFKHGQKRLF
jgi:spoIIIJ-associated protein